MTFIADFHMHSRFSRACSKKLTLPNNAAWAQIKGVDLITTADFTFPAWFKELHEQLDEVGESELHADEARALSEIVAGVANYEEHYEKMVESFHKVEEGKEYLEERFHSSTELIEELLHAHEEELAEMTAAMNAEYIEPVDEDVWKD